MPKTQFEDTQRVYIEGPVYNNGQRLDGRHYRLHWKNGYAGPLFYNEVLRATAIIPATFKIISEEDYFISSAGQAELESMKGAMADAMRKTYKKNLPQNLARETKGKVDWVPIVRSADPDADQVADITSAITGQETKKVKDIPFDLTKQGVRNDIAMVQEPKYHVRHIHAWKRLMKEAGKPPVVGGPPLKQQWLAFREEVLDPFLRETTV